MPPPRESVEQQNQDEAESERIREELRRQQELEEELRRRRGESDR